MSKALENIRETAVKALEKRFAEMLDRADDTLFDMAEKAGGTRDQQAFFEAMRELRVQRKNMESRFRQEIVGRFQTSRGNADNDIPTIPSIARFDELSLVNEDELEDNLAIDGMAQRTLQRNDDLLRQLTRRYGELLKQPELPLEEFPLHPLHLSEAMRTAGKQLHLTAKARLVVYKLFERSVLAEMSPLYSELNEKLIQQGILPSLKPVKTPASASAAAREQARARLDASLGDDGSGPRELFQEEVRLEVFNAIRDLLAIQKGGSVSVTDGGMGIPLMPMVETPQLMQALSNLQHDAGMTQGLIADTDVRTALAARLPIMVGRVDGGSIGSINDDVIDIVSMLFEFIWGDNNLPNEIKTQLARLQIPMLKVAITDKTFFSNRGHPARLLLNEMAYAGLGWDPERRGKDGLQGKIEQLIQRVLNDYEDDGRLFEELLLDFRTYVDEERRRAAIIEKRIREAEEGKARNEMARAAAERALTRVIGSRRPPAEIMSLLKDAWVKVLQLEHLRTQSETGPFQRHLVTADMLIRSVCINSAEERARLPRLIPLVVRQLKTGFEAIALDPMEQTQRLLTLEDIHVQLLRGPANERPITGMSVLARDESTATLAEVAEKSEMDLLAESLPDLTDEDAALLDSYDVAPAETAPTPDIPLLVVAGIEDEFFHKVDQFAVGAWIQIRDEKGKSVRCKLAAKIPTIDRYIFVNRAGMKVTELHRTEFALALQEGDIKSIDDAALFDRALEAVIGNLRRLKADD